MQLQITMVGILMHVFFFFFPPLFSATMYQPHVNNFKGNQKFLSVFIVYLLVPNNAKRERDGMLAH